MLPDDTPVGGGLYIIRLSDTHYYGGRARSFKVRWRNHLRDLRAGTHENPRMQAVYNKHNRFEPSVLTRLPPGNQEAAEQAWLDANYRKPGCVNLSPLARGGCAGHTAETRAKMSATRASRPDLVEKARQTLNRNRLPTGTPRAEAHCQAISAAMTGKVQTPEHIAKRVAAHLGRKNTDSTRSLMSESASRRAQEYPTVHGDGTRALISSQQRGRIWINNGMQNMRLHPDEAQPYVDQGWTRGRWKAYPDGPVGADQR